MSLYTPFILLILPLIGAVLTLVFFNRNNTVTGITSAGLQALAFIFSLIICFEVWTDSMSINYTWIKISGQSIDFSLYIDRIAALLLIIVHLISFLVQLFSTEYMKTDDGYNRYFTQLNFFTFSMTGIVISGNLLLMFMFWELVGFCSYLLIGFWNDKISAAKAAKKAFVVNRIGDIGFIIALALCWFHFQTFDIQLIKEALYGNETAYSTLAISALGCMFFIGAIGKSAQFPLQVWLPDAMEGPTPVSALIHAATMVAAGVYLMVRLFFLLNPDVLFFIGLIGAITAFMGAVAALFQNDIKKVLAFSTISQLGYMMVGIGTGSYEAATFHLFTHAFFKAGLFLAAGAIIHSLHKSITDDDIEVQDMRNMGGLKSKMPFIFYTYLIFSFALIGLPLFSGYLSKESILSGAFTLSSITGGAYWIITILSFVSVGLTAFYVIRMLMLVFWGAFRGSNEDLIKDSSIIYKIVLTILAIGSISFTWSIDPLNFDASWLLRSISVATVIEHSLMVPILSNVLIIAGIGWAFSTYKIYSTQKTSTGIARISINNWYLDQLYQIMILTPVLWLSNILIWVEKRIIDRAVDILGIGTVIISHVIAWIDRFFVDGAVNVSAYFAGRTGALTRSMQGGKVQTYILLAVLGLVIIIILAL